MGEKTESSLIPLHFFIFWLHSICEDKIWSRPTLLAPKYHIPALLMDIFSCARTQAAGDRVYIFLLSQAASLWSHSSVCSVG